MTRISWRLSLFLATVAACALAVTRAPTPALALEGPTLLAGDSVRFVARFVPPPASAGIDSITIRWSLSGNNNQFRRFVAPFPTQIQDTAKFFAGPTQGGGTAGGDIVVRTWRATEGSAGLVRIYQVTLAPTAPPPEVTGFAFVDSARVY